MLKIQGQINHYEGNTPAVELNARSAEEYARRAAKGELTCAWRVRDLMSNCAINILNVNTVNRAKNGTQPRTVFTALFSWKDLFINTPNSLETVIRVNYK